MAPYVSDRMVGGAYCATEGKANPLAQMVRQKVHGHLLLERQLVWQ